MVLERNIDKEKINQWLIKKHNTDNIRLELSSVGYDEEEIEMYISEFKKARNARRQKIAFILLATGSVLGFVSCVVSIANPVPGIFKIVLYGLTSIAVLIVFAGLYYLFE